MAFFSDFQYDLRSSRSTSDLLTAVSDGISRALNRFRVTQALALNISKAFDRVWHAGFHKLKFYGTLGELFGLILFYLQWLRVVLDGKSSQEYPVNAGFPQDYSWSHTFSTIY